MTDSASVRVSTLALGLALVLLALALRLVVHWGRQPGGVDTWYHLAYARAIRRHRSLHAPLPQYLLQDVRQSYPPLFPLFLALLPAPLLDRWFWLVSPLLDGLHLALLYAVSLRLTQERLLACFAVIVYAVTPQLVSEVRSLNARSFGALVHTVAVLACLKATLSAASPLWLGAACVAGAAVILASATASVAYALLLGLLALRFGEVRFVVIGATAGALAAVVSRGHLFRVLLNYVHAARYCAEHRGRFGSHPVRNSSLYGEPLAHGGAERGFLGRSTFTQALRLLGENPFIVALALVPSGGGRWSEALWFWAVCIAAIALVATLVPFLRVLGPGRSFLKAGIFPAAYSLASGIGSPAGFGRPVGVAALLGVAASIGAIAFFVRYVRAHPFQTVSVPAGLAAAIGELRRLPAGGVFCLPDVYADLVAYQSGRPVLWGGHCGDLSRFAWIAPVIARPIPELLDETGVRFMLFDERYARPEELKLAGRVRLLGSWDEFRLYAFSPRDRPDDPGE